MLCGKLVFDRFPCGQCLTCRINARRLWSHRLMLEARMHEFASFWTLTYNDEKLPADGSLNKADYVGFLKRLRSRLALSGRSCRFYLVGEYGDDKERPHYHVILYGVSHVEHALIDGAWGKGYVQGLKLDRGLSEYVCKYTLKRMTKADDPRLRGRLPEFSRMSRNPGIGASFVTDKLVPKLPSSSLDVPTALNTGGQTLPLGRYLRNVARKHIYGCIETPPEAQRARMLSMQEATYPAEAQEARSIAIERLHQLERKDVLFPKKGKL